MTTDHERENAELRAELEELREQLKRANRKATRALASFQHRALALEVVRQDNEKLDRLTTQLDEARAAAAARALELERTNDALQARERENAALIEELRVAVERLSTPIIRVWDGVLAIPIIGTIAQERASVISERTLSTVTTTGARHVILDITGVETIDAKTIHYIVQLVRALRLLGARCVLSGMRPGVAQAIVARDIPLQGIVSTRTLADALAAILHEQRE